MPRTPRAFVATSPLLHLHPCWATSRADAARQLLDAMEPERRGKFSEEELARRVGQLRWCPRHELLWFKPGSARVALALHPCRVPDDLWPGIEVLEAKAVDERHSFAHGPGPRRVPAEAFRAKAGRGRPA